MARTGFYDKTQDLYLPKDSTTWAGLTSDWSTYTGWYQSLSSVTELEYTSDIIDLGYSHQIYPLITITALTDGANTAPSYGAEYPEVLIEGSNNSDMSSASSITLTRTSNPEFVGLGSKRYYRVTVTINTGSNNAPQGFKSIGIKLLSDAIEETIEGWVTSVSGKTVATKNTYSSISYVGTTPLTTITDTVVTGVSDDGSSVILYVATGYVNTGYFVGDTGSSSATVTSITTIPLIQVVSKSTDSFVVEVYKPVSGDNTNVTLDAYVRGLPQVALDINGNVVRSA
jgi:hypothetical protein